MDHTPLRAELIRRADATPTALKYPRMPPSRCDGAG
jgi:hypothetical protein